MRAVIYARVSQDPKQRWRSVNEQLAECRKECEANGWPVVAEFVDNDRSASRYAKKVRTGFLEVSRYIEGHNADVLVTWEGSRANRDLERFVALRKLLEETGCKWAYDGHVLDMADARDRKQAGRDALDAEDEAERTRDRVMRAMKANRATGRPHGKIPYGYQRAYDTTTGTIREQTIKESEAAIIREAAARFLNGETPYAIAKSYNERGIPAPRAGEYGWTLTQVRRLLLNPTYIAKRTHKGEIVGDGTWPAILDESTFQRCAAKFADPSRKTTHEHAVKFLLSGIASCGVCGGRVKVGRPKGISTYICSQGFCVARKVESVDEQVTRLLLNRLAMPDALAEFSTTENTYIETTLNEVAALRARLDEFYDSAARGEVSPTALARIEQQIYVQIKEKEASLRFTDVPPVLFDLAQDPYKHWEKLTLEEKRAVIRAFMTIELLLTKRGSKKLDPESVHVEWRTASGSTAVAQ